MKALSLFALLLAATAVADNERRLIAFDENSSAWLTEEQIIDLAMKNINFMDITDTEIIYRKHRQLNFPSQPQFQDVVRPMLAQLSPSFLRTVIANMSDYHTRYYTQPTALEAAVWLQDFIAGLAGDRLGDDVEVELFEHSFGVQPTVIAKILGTELPHEIVVVGAHEDSIAGAASNRSPGADDDATGVANFVDVFRVFMETGFRPRRSIHMMGYAAEEVGLRGSQDVARVYANDGEEVVAVYQCEMSGWIGNNYNIAIIDDRYTHTELTQFMSACIAEYCDIPGRSSTCGYGCSDHASWTNQGFPAVCVAEAGPFDGANPYMHTSNDVLDHLDMDYATESSKAALSFAVELSLTDL